MDIHDEHCSNCFISSCAFKECGMIKCKHCHVLLHSCKVEEHIEIICRRALVNCPNNSNGCSSLLVREKIACHLRNCVASVVVCSRDRCRKLNVKQGKLQLKHLGRRREFLPVREDVDIDIQLTCYDQNLIVDSYDSSRTKRVKQRDPLHPAHPLIPLRNMPHDISITTEGLDDSSEDELREKREKLKKSRLVFANCYMCQIDPSVQHLHTLGNGSDIEKLKKRRRTEQVLDKFHEKLNLKISNTVENAPESTLKSENIREIKKGGTFYTLKCLKTVRRSEYGDHCLSQHSNTVDQLNEIILRCPNWERGCPFTDSRIKVKTGNLRFHVHSSTFSHEPLPNYEWIQAISSSPERNFENLPLWVYESLATYLPSSSLYNLSLASKKMRQMVFIGCNNRCYVEPVWKTDEIGSWKQDGFIWKISSSEAPPALEWNVPVGLSQHISKCTYFGAIQYEEQAVPVFPPDLEKDIWEGFSNKLSEMAIRQELIEEDDDW